MRYVSQVANQDAAARDTGLKHGVGMQIEVKFFAGLRERFGESERCLTVASGTTVAALWREVSGDGELGENLRAAVNHEYCGPEHVLGAGDEVAFFPPVTGG